MRTRLAKIGLLLLNAVVPVFVAACYGIQHLCTTGRVVDKTTGQGISGIRVSCLVSNGPALFSMADDVTGDENRQSCGGGAPDSDSDMDSDGDVDDDTDVDTDSDTDGDTDSETGADTETDAVPDSGVDTDFDSDTGATADAGADMDAGTKLAWETYTMPGDGAFALYNEQDISCQAIRCTDIDGQVNGLYKELTLWGDQFQGVIELDPIE